MEACVRFTDIKRIVAGIQGECAENGLYSRRRGALDFILRGWH